MAWQLIFTSAAAGLQPGSFGYCTVARSAAMRDAVASRLEQWSVYTHTTSGTQPIISSHRILTLGRSSYHVLTRMTDSGLDYTGRTNFLAHHLVLQEFELGEASSPADLLAGWGGWRAQWSGEPRLFSAEEDVLELRVTANTELPAKNWRAATGEDGAATWLINDIGTSSRLANVIVHPTWEEKWLLGLYAESLCLLDPKRTSMPAWSVPFTTYLQAENGSGDFQWRGAWPGTTALVDNAITVDFCRGEFPPLTSSSGLLSLARTGKKLEISLPAAVSTMVSSHATPSYRDDDTPTRRTVISAKSSAVQKKYRWWMPAAIGGLFFVGLVLFAAVYLVNRSQPQQMPTPSPRTLAWAESTPQAIVTPANVAVAPSLPPVAPTPEDPAEQAKRKAEAQAREQKEKHDSEISRELAKLPTEPTLIALDSVKKLDMSSGLDPATEVGQRFRKIITENIPSVIVELRDGRFESTTPPAESRKALRDNGQLTPMSVSDNPPFPTYVFKEKGVQTTDSVAEDFIWLTLRPEPTANLAINFVLAKDARAFERHCPRLSTSVFIKNELSPPILSIPEEVFERLRVQLSTWQGLESWVSDSGRKKQFELQATLKNITYVFAARDESAIYFTDVIGNAEADSERANSELTEAEQSLRAEQKRQENFLRAQAHLSKMTFSDNEVRTKLGGEATPTASDFANVSSYNRMIISALQKVSGDNFTPSIGERFKTILQYQDYSLHLSQTLDQLAVDAQQKGVDPKLSKQMLSIISDIRHNVEPEDAVFFEQDSAKADPVSMKKSLSEKVSAYRHAKERQQTAQANAAIKPTSELIESISLMGRINGKPVRLIEFVGS